MEPQEHPILRHFVSSQNDASSGFERVIEGLAVNTVVWAPDCALRDDALRDDALQKLLEYRNAILQLAEEAQ